MKTDYVHVDVFSSLPYGGNSLAVCPDARGLTAMQDDGVVSRAFRESSAGRAENGLIVMFPGECTASGDVYVKTGALKGHKSYVVKVSPWFSGNVALRHRQGGFIAVFDSQTGHTLAILDEAHYLSDIRTAAAGCLAARALAPASVRTAAVLGAGVQAFWQPQALFRERLSKLFQSG